MSEFDQISVLDCRNEKCSHRMVLPTPEHPHPENPSWPLGHRELSFLCPQCNQVRVYSIGSVTRVDPPPVLSTVYKVVLIALRCPTASCDRFIQIRTLLRFDQDPRAKFREIQDLVARSTAHDWISCDQGHTLNGPLPQMGIQDAAGWDNLWKQ